MSLRYGLPSTTPTRYRCIQIDIPDDEEYYQLFVSHLRKLAVWNTYDRDSAKRGRVVANIWKETLRSILDVCSIETVVEVIREEPQYFTEFIEVIGDDVARFSTEVVNGNTYLVEDCGCGQIKRYALTPVDAQSVELGAPGANPGGWPPNSVQIVPQSKADCYAAKASQIVVESATAYASRIIDAYSGALDFVSDPTDIVDVAGELIDLARNRDAYESLQRATKEEVATSIAKYQPNLEVAWDFDGPVNRLDLIGLTTQAYPVFDGIINIGFITGQWALFANMKQLNARLALAASECVSGQNIGGEPDGALTFIDSTTDGDVTYQAFRVGAPGFETGTSSGPKELFTYNIPQGTTVYGYAVLYRLVSDIAFGRSAGFNAIIQDPNYSGGDNVVPLGAAGEGVTGDLFKYVQVSSSAPGPNGETAVRDFAKTLPNIQPGANDIGPPPFWPGNSGEVLLQYAPSDPNIELAASLYVIVASDET